MKRIIIMFLSFYMNCLFGNTVSDWKDHLREAIQNDNELEFFQENDLTLPSGVVIVHSWNASPIKEDESTVGHLSLQISDLYISVWPEDSDDPYSPIRLSSFHEDFEVMGTSQYLILQLQEDEYNLVYQEAENTMMNFMENQDDYAFTIGSFEIKTPHGDPKNSEYMTVSASLSSGESAFSIRNKSSLQHIVDAAKEQFAEKLNFKKYVGRVAGGCSGFAAGAAACGVAESFVGGIGSLMLGSAAAGPIALAAVIGGVAIAGIGTTAGHFIAKGVTCISKQNFEYPVGEGHRPLEVCYRMPTFNEKISDGRRAVCCKTSVYSVLKQSQELTKYIDATDKESCSLRADLYLNLYGSVTELREALQKSDDPDRVISDFIRERGNIRTRNSKSDVVLNKITSCLSKNNQKDIKDIIKEVLVSLIAAQSGDFKKFENILDDLELNKGKLSILLANPSILPGSSLQNLGASLSESTNYVASSFEKDLGAPVTTKIQFKELLEDKYLGIKKINGQVKVIVDSKKNLDCYDFRLIQVSASENKYALYNDTLGLTIQADNHNELCVHNPDFSEEESFLIVHNSIDSRSLLPFSHPSHIFAEKEWIIESFEQSEGK
ncbi:MAG: hypothetical protein AB8C84_12465 [Oligoflexales bacterium]